MRRSYLFHSVVSSGRFVIPRRYYVAVWDTDDYDLRGCRYYKLANCLRKFHSLLFFLSLLLLMLLLRNFGDFISAVTDSASSALIGRPSRDQETLPTTARKMMDLGDDIHPPRNMATETSAWEKNILQQRHSAIVAKNCAEKNIK